MEITAKELRGKPTQIIEQASRGTEVIITIHGKRMAKLVPLRSEEKQKGKQKVDDEIFGMWKDHGDFESVDKYVRSIRKGRTY
jgi:prevent-host-death family protein